MRLNLKQDNFRACSTENISDQPCSTEKKGARHCSIFSTQVRHVSTMLERKKNSAIFGPSKICFDLVHSKKISTNAKFVLTVLNRRQNSPRHCSNQARYNSSVLYRKRMCSMISCLARPKSEVWNVTDRKKIVLDCQLSTVIDRKVARTRSTEKKDARLCSSKIILDRKDCARSCSNQAIFIPTELYF